MAGEPQTDSVNDGEATIDKLGNIVIFATGQIIPAEIVEPLWMDLSAFPAIQALILPVANNADRYLFFTRKKPEIN